MRRKIRLVLFALIAVVCLSSCSTSPERALTQEKTNGAETESQTEVITENTTETPASAPNVKAESEGQIWQKKMQANRPVAVMLDNHAGARPQAGLKDAEIVIEALAEGNITRYMAFFFEGMPESIGPIRSARPYFLDRSMEFNAVYVHVGGSPKALSDIKKLKIADLDGLSSSQKVFFRKKHKKVPHNLYSSLEILRNESEKRAFAQEPTTTQIEFADQDTVPKGETAVYVKLPYRKNDGGYMVSYDYIIDTKLYQRSINAKVHLDEIDQSPITAKNILIQYVPTRVVDDAGRLDLELVGSGSGWWLTDGIKVPITWEKASRQAETNYMGPDGAKINLNPGNTWIQIIPKSMTIQWEKI